MTGHHATPWMKLAHSYWIRTLTKESNCQGIDLSFESSVYLIHRHISAISRKRMIHVPVLLFERYLFLLKATYDLNPVNQVQLLKDSCKPSWQTVFSWLGLADCQMFVLGVCNISLKGVGSRLGLTIAFFLKSMSGNCVIIRTWYFVLKLKKRNRKKNCVID